MDYSRCEGRIIVEITKDAECWGDCGKKAKFLIQGSTDSFGFETDELCESCYEECWGDSPGYQGRRTLEDIQDGPRPNSAADMAAIVEHIKEKKGP